MNKRENKRKINIFDNGGLISWLNNTGSKLSGNSRSILGLNSEGLSLAGGIANTVAGVANGLMNPSGNSTGVGNVLSGVGSLASNIPGIGGLVGAGVNLLGGLVNAAFGSNINEEYVDLTKSNITNQAGYTSKASTNDQLMSDWGSHTNLAYVDQDDVGSDGWFSNKAKNLTKDLNSQIDEANLKALLSLSNTAGNIDTQNDLNLLANFKADGGGIHIKKKNRGKFTSYCGGKVTSECIARGKRSSSPTIRKRATFAQNARKFKHDNGGPLDSLVADINRRSNADFVKRLQDPNRDYIQDWATDNIATHKLSWASDDNGAIVFPNVQRINGKLYDFTDPANKRGEWDALDSAIERGDTLRMSPSQAKEFTETYKKYYPKGKTFRANGGWLGTGINENVATAASFLPVVGTIMDGAEFIHDPSWENAGWFLSGLASDIFTGGAARAAIKAAKLARKSSKVAKALKAKRLESALRRGNQNYKGSMASYRKFKEQEAMYNQEVKNNIAKAIAAQGADATLNSSQQTLKAEGGPLFTQGGIWSNGITTIGNGGTHEENPYEGVQMGVDNQGIPNLVEEGEVIWNDYVFSNRLKPNKDMKKKNKYKGTTFSNIAKNLQKESEERPNDPISNRGLNASMERLASLQESIRAKKADREARRYAKGGKLGTLYAGEGDRSNRLNTYSNYTGLSDDSFYTPEYMNFWRWIDKNRNSSSAKNWLNRINNEEFGTVGGNTFTMDDIVRLAHDYKRGPVHNAFLRASREFANSEENPLTPLTAKPLVPPMATPPIVESPERIPVGTIDAETDGNYPEYLRYAPIVGHGISVFSDLFSKPDYSAADRAASVRVNPALVSFNPIGNYLSYEPFDRDFYINKLNANSAATRRALQNTSGGNRLQAQAGILAADNNYGNQLGDLARQAEEYNQQLRERVEGFNRQTNMYNSEMGLKASMANAESRNQATKMRLGQAGTVAAMRQAIRDAYNQRRSNNINVLLGELGDLGREAAQRRWLDDLAEAGVLRMDTSGNYVAPKAKGGKIRTKKRKGFTYG